MLLVVARVEGEGDDVGDRVDGEAREDDPIKSGSKPAARSNG